MGGRMVEWAEDADWVGAFALLYAVLEYESRRLAARANPPARDWCDPDNRLRRETYGRWGPSFVHAVACVMLSSSGRASRARDMLVVRHSLGYFAADSWVDRDPAYYLHHAALYFYYAAAKYVGAGPGGGPGGGYGGGYGGGPGGGCGELDAGGAEIGFCGFVSLMRVLEAGNVVAHGARLLLAAATDARVPQAIRKALNAHVDVLPRVATATFVVSRAISTLRSVDALRTDVPPALRARFLPVALACMLAVLWSNLRALRDGGGRPPLNESPGRPDAARLTPRAVCRPSPLGALSRM